MSSGEPFGPWVEPMERVGARNPRSRDGQLSWNALAQAAQVSTTALTNMVYHRAATSPDTVRKVADALGESPETVSGWLELTRPVRDTYTPPRQAALLHDHERKAISDLIRAIARGREDRERDDVHSPITRAGVSPAAGRKEAGLLLVAAMREQGIEPRAIKGLPRRTVAAIVDGHEDVPAGDVYWLAGLLNVPTERVRMLIEPEPPAEAGQSG